MQIKNIIFDLGGVIIDIDPARTLSGFATLSGKTEPELTKMILARPEIFAAYETGMIDTAGFRHELNCMLNCNMTEKEFADAWNSIIFSIPDDRISILRQLKTRYRLFMLSNTNDLHARRVDEIVASSHTASGLFAIFEKVYYSYRIHMKKPEPETFWYVLKENNLEPSQTLFIDDLPENIEGAKTTGMQVLHAVRNKPVFDHLL